MNPANYKWAFFHVLMIFSAKRHRPILLYPDECAHLLFLTQAGAYLPFFRAHAHLDTKRREPWLFEDKYKNLMRDAIRHRYALLPFWYTLFHEASKSGSPIVTYVKFQSGANEIDRNPSHVFGEYLHLLQ